MAQSHTRFVGMAVHQDAIAVASVAQEHGAEGMDRRAIGTRPWALDPLIRTRPSNATPLIFVYDLTFAQNSGGPKPIK
jgi:hypothetical protein